MTRATEIRAWLALNASEDNPASNAEVCAGVGINTQQASSTLTDLKRAGYVGCTGPGYQKRYWGTGKVRSVASTADEKREKARLGHEVRRRLKGMRSREQWKAETKAKSEAARIAKAIAKPIKIRASAEHTAAVEKARAQRRTARNRALRDSARANIAGRPVYRGSSKTPLLRVTTKPTPQSQAVRDIAADIAAWEASGGVIAKLELGEVSPANRLKDHDLLTAEKWNNRRTSKDMKVSA